MKKLAALFLFGLLVLAVSCTSSTKKSGDFKLLPQPQQIDLTGVSELKPKDLVLFYSEDAIDLPMLGTILSNIQETKERSKAQIVYNIDSLSDMKQEAYSLTILVNQIQITAKDRAGLLYAFMTLEQLSEDALEQEVALPLCEIKDEPKLSYRSIHLDMKHPF